MCAKFRKGHFEGVLDVLERFVKQISPRIMFLGEKDYQQYFLVKNFISKKYTTEIYPCETIRKSGYVQVIREIILDNLFLSAVQTKPLSNNRVSPWTHRFVVNEVLNCCSQYCCLM